MMSIHFKVMKVSLVLIVLVILSSMSIRIGMARPSNIFKSITTSNFLILDLFHIISNIESNGNANAHNVKENAKGIVQIRAIAVKDINRIYGTHYKHTDAHDSSVAFTMFSAYIKAYVRNLSIREVGRVWNGGPKGKLSKQYSNKLTKYGKAYNNKLGKTVSSNLITLNLNINAYEKRN